MRRVVITGMGAITPLGNDVSELWEGIRANKIGFNRITKFNTEGFKTKLAAEVKSIPAASMIENRQLRKLDLFSQYAICAAGEALRQSGLDLSLEDVQRIGCIVGTGLGGIGTLEFNCKKLIGDMKSKVSPLLMPMMLTNMAAGNISVFFGIKGKSMSISTACATGTNAIGEAFRSIKYGESDIMITGGTEAPITPVIIKGFEALNAMSKSEEKECCSIPFDIRRDGFVIGEGAGILVLEELEHARHRNAIILGEIGGYGSFCDAYHMTLPDQEGTGSAKAMEMALFESGIEKEELYYLNAHGTGTKQNDLCETRAIKKVFNEHAYRLMIHSTKSMIGHLLGAAGAVEAIVCVMTLLNGYVHPTVGLGSSEEELDLNYVRCRGINVNVDFALSNSLGFGGHNASLLIKKYRK